MQIEGCYSELLAAGTAAVRTGGAILEWKGKRGMRCRANG